MTDAGDAGRTGERLSGHQPPVIVPELEHQERPERLAVVADPVAVLADPAGDLVGAEQPLALQAVAARAARRAAGRAGRGASGRPGCRTPSWAAQDRRREPARRGPLEQPLGLAPAVLERRRAAAGSSRPARRPGTGRGPPGRRPCWPGRPWSGCPRAGTYPGTAPASASSGSAPGARAAAARPGARPRRRSRAAVDQQVARSRPRRTSRASADAPAAAARPAPRRNCLSLKSKLKLP